MKFRITNTVQYSEYIYIEADDEQSARDEACGSSDWIKEFNEEIYDTEVEDLSDLSDEEWEEAQ